MKTPVSPHMVAFLLFGTIAPLTAQNLVGVAHSSETDVAITLDRYDLPSVEKARGELPESSPVYAAQDALTLDPRSSSRQNVEAVVDLTILRRPSPYRKVATSSELQPYEIASDSLQTGLAMMSAVYREAGKRSESSDCPGVALSVEQRTKLDVSNVLEVVETEVSANPTCSCEIVKMAISATDADVPLVVSIVETAITAAPDNMRIISQCAIAAMPESIAAVQALLAKLDPNSGNAGYSSKSSKSSKSAKAAEVASIESPATPNPLDLPPAWPTIIPLIIIPPVTEVNPLP